MSIIEILNQYGFATLAAIAMGWFIYFIYRFTTENLKKKLGEANTALIGLLDTVLEIQENEKRDKNSKRRKSN